MDRDIDTACGNERGDRPRRKKWVRVLIAIAYGIIISINSLCALGLFLSSYAHLVSPLRWAPSVLVAMTLPIWLILTLVLFAIDLIWWRRIALIPGLMIIVCAQPIANVFPLNFPKRPLRADQKEHSFTIMTYNTAAFADMHPEKQHGRNRQLGYILDKSPDMVCIQESSFLAPTEANCITQSQLDLMHRMYPYVLTHGDQLSFLSKYPAEPINLDFPVEEFSSGDMAAWRVSVGGKVLNVFTVHLRSFGLTDTDKTVYEDIVKLDSISKNGLIDARFAILPKISSAGVERARQIEYLQKYLSKYGGHNAIVCGDFNDVAESNALYELTSESHMREVYPEVGFGPMFTFNANYMYFRIDHILYRGDMRPYKMHVGSIGASDHYPLIATFVMN